MATRSFQQLREISWCTCNDSVHIMVLDLLHNFVKEDESFESIDHVESHSGVIRNDSAFQHFHN